MSFNYRLLRELRHKSGIKRSDFADLLGITEDRLYRYETGQRRPGVSTIEKIAFYSGVEIGAFFTDDDDSSGTPDKPGKAVNLLDLTNRLNQSRHETKQAKEKEEELARLTEHLMSVNELYVKFSDILSLDLVKQERSKKLAVLARTAAKDGELRFDEIACILRVTRSTLKRWLESSKTSYSCRLREGITVTASTPGEAEMWFACFDCEAKAKGSCRGYGNSLYPENIFVLIALLKANGIDSRIEQSKLLAETFGVELSPHQISEIMSREKNGKPVKEDLVDLKVHKRIGD
jgi:transcriptional regulator with XRE-family HTH domain